MTSIFQEQNSSNSINVINGPNDQSNQDLKSNNTSYHLFQSKSSKSTEKSLKQEQNTSIPFQNSFCQTLLDNSISSPLRNAISSLPQPDLNRISHLFHTNSCNAQKDFFVKEIPDGYLKHQSSILHFHSKNNCYSSRPEKESDRKQVNIDQQTDKKSPIDQVSKNEIENFYKEKYYQKKEKYKEAKQTIDLLRNQLQQVSQQNLQKENDQSNTKSEQLIAFKKKCKILQEENIKLKATIANQNQQIEELKSTIESRKQQIKESKILIEKLSLQVKESKTTIENMNQQNIEPKSIIEKQNTQIEKSKGIIENQKHQINKYKAANEKQSLQINKYKTANEKQNLKINKSQIIIEKQNQQISQLQNKISELMLNTNNSNKNNEGHNNYLKGITIGIKRKGKEIGSNLKKGHFHIKGSIKSKSQRSSSALSNYHQFELTPHPIKQYKYLCNMLNVEPDEFDQQWNKVFRKIADLLNSLTALKQSKNASNEHISLSYQLATTKKIDSKKKKNINDDTFCELDLLRKQYDDMSKKIENFRLSSKFGNLISKFNSDLYKEIEDLHSSVTMKKHSHFREIILTVIFINRMLNIIKYQSYLNEKSLTVFPERPIYSPDVLIRDIRSSFTSLTQDLVYSQHLVGEKL